MAPFEVQGRVLPFWKPPINIFKEPDCHGCCCTLNLCQAMLKNCIRVSRLCTELYLPYIFNVKWSSFVGDCEQTEKEMTVSSIQVKSLKGQFVPSAETVLRIWYILGHYGAFLQSGRDLVSNLTSYI